MCCQRSSSSPRGAHTITILRGRTGWMRSRGAIGCGMSTISCSTRTQTRGTHLEKLIRGGLHIVPDRRRQNDRVVAHFSILWTALLDQVWADLFDRFRPHLLIPVHLDCDYTPLGTTEAPCCARSKLQRSQSLDHEHSIRRSIVTDPYHPRKQTTVRNVECICVDYASRQRQGILKGGDRRLDRRGSLSG